MPNTGVYRSSPPTLANNQEAEIGLTVNGDTQVGLAAGTAVVGKVGIDQTTPGTTDSVTVATGQGAGATIGAVADAVVAAGAAGTLSAKLRRVTQGLEDLKSLIVLAAGEAHVGQVGGHTGVLTVASVVSAGAIYAAGDALGGRLDLTSAVRVSGGTGIIQGITIIDLDQERAEIDIVFFNQAFTATADNAAFDPSDADLANCIGFVKVLSSDYANFNDNAVATLNGIGMPFKCEGSTTLYAQMVVRGTPTYTATTDIKVLIRVLQD